MRNSGLAITQRPIASFLNQIPTRSFTTPTPEVDSDLVENNRRNNKRRKNRYGFIATTYRAYVKDEKRDRALVIREL